MPKSLARQIPTVALSNLIVFIALFLVLEVGLRIYTDGPRGAVSGLLSEGVVPYSNVGTGRWIIHDDELGYRLNPDRNDGRVNARSVRGPAIVVPKPAGVFRIVVVGDSIPWDEPGFVGAFADQFDRANGVEVINASVPGYTSYQEARFFKRYLLETEPDLVLWTYCLNDNHKFLHVFDQDARMLTTAEARASVQIRSEWDWIVGRSYVLSTLHIASLARRVSGRDTPVDFPWEAQPDFNTAWKDYSWDAYEAQLREMADLLGGRNARLAIVVFPYEPQLLHRSMHDKRDYVLAPQRHLAELCGRYSIPCLDLFPAFERAYDAGRTLYRDGIHLNLEGHELTVAELLAFARRHELLPS